MTADEKDAEIARLKIELRTVRHAIGAALTEVWRRKEASGTPSAHPSLFAVGNFVLHSGESSHWKVDCDTLTIIDWLAISLMVSEQITYREVEGVPRGGTMFAAALQAHARSDGEHALLIVDDVITTGASMEKQRNGRDALGIVLFSRCHDLPQWIRPIWQLGKI